MYEVEISSDEAFYLSCWSQVLIIHDDDHVTMAIDSKHEEKVLKKLQDKGKAKHDNEIFKLLCTLSM